jgi:microcystin-dependent protein
MDGVLGYITLFAGNFAPNNWAYCNGQLLPVAQYRALFNILGKTYGGDGINTFGLPNLQGRAVVAAGNNGFSSYKQGQQYGNEYTILNMAQVPPHTHPVAMSVVPPCAGLPTSTTPNNAMYASGANDLYNFSSNTALAAYNGTIEMSDTGNGLPVPTLHPVLGLNYIICLNGQTPPTE